MRTGTPPRTARPAPRGGVPVAGLAILVVIVIIAIAISMSPGGGKSYVENAAETRRSAQRLDVSLDTRSIVQMVTAFQLEHNRLPSTFDELGMTPPRDPWGAPLSFSIDSSTRPPTLVVTSRGPDGEPGTEDDVVRREPLPM